MTPEQVSEDGRFLAYIANLESAYIDRLPLVLDLYFEMFHVQPIFN